MSARPEGRTRALQYAFAAHLRDPEHNRAPEGLDERRLAVYRDLFFNNIESLLSSNFPVLRRLYGDEAWRALVRTFYAEHTSHTPIFTEIPREFMRYLETRAERGEDDPPFLIELAHYEWSELALMLDENEIDDVPHDPLGDVSTGVPVLSPLVRVLAYHFPVHHISPAFRPTEPSGQPTLILLVRDRADAIGFLEIDALTALLIERVKENDTLSGLECLKQLLRGLGREGDDALLATGQAVLADLRHREALLGTRR